MSGGWPIDLEAPNFFSQGDNYVSNAGGTQVTAGNGAYGTMTQIVAATPYDASWMIVTWGGLANNTYAQYQAICNIAIGPSGSEKIIARDLMAQVYKSTGGNQLIWNYSFPINIPKGTRLSAQVCEGGGSDQFGVQFNLGDGAFTQTDGCGGVDSMGINIPSSKGTAISSGTQVMGSWVQMIAATARDYIGLMIGVDTQNGSIWGDSYWYDIGIGPSGSEQVIIPKFATGGNPVGYMPGSSAFMPVQVPAGSRLAARCMNYNGNSTGSSISLYGIYR